MFSRRVPHDLRPTAWARARADRGEVPYDLTVSNPTRCGLPYPENLLAPLGDPAGLTYRPDPKGGREAREAVAGEAFNVGDDGENYRVREIAEIVARTFPGCTLTVGEVARCMRESAGGDPCAHGPFSGEVCAPFRDCMLIQMGAFHVDPAAPPE